MSTYIFESSCLQRVIVAEDIAAATLKLREQFDEQSGLCKSTITATFGQLMAAYEIETIKRDGETVLELN